MDPIAAVSQSADTVAQILQMATKQTEMAEKMIKVNLEMSLAVNPGIGQAIDMVA